MSRLKITRRYQTTMQSNRPRSTSGALMLLLLATLAGLTSLWASQVTQADESAVQAPVLAPLATHPRTARIVVEQLRRNHYVDMQVNDSLSSDMFDNYLEALDLSLIHI